MNLDPEFGHCEGLNERGAAGLVFVGRVNDLDMIRLVPRHHLIAGDTVKHRMHDGPLPRRFAPAALGFLSGKLDDTCESNVAVQRAVHNENAAPNDVAWL